MSAFMDFSEGAESWGGVGKKAYGVVGRCGDGAKGIPEVGGGAGGQSGPGLGEGRKVPPACFGDGEEAGGIAGERGEPLMEGVFPRGG